MEENYYISICLITKNSNDYLLEWVDYHLSIGIDHIYIYDDGSSITLGCILGEYIKSGKVTYKYQNYGYPSQFVTYFNCLNQHAEHNTWIAFIDDDEFIFPKNISLKKLLKQYELYGGLGINWQLFGSSGHKTKQDSVLKNYVYKVEQNNAVNKHIKTIVNTKYVKIEMQRNPHSFSYIGGNYCVNEDYVKIPDNCPFAEEVSIEKIQLNHYSLKSEQDYCEKMLKGRADSISRHDMNVFNDVDKQCIIYDNSINEFFEGESLEL